MPITPVLRDVWTPKKLHSQVQLNAARFIRGEITEQEFERRQEKLWEIARGQGRGCVDELLRLIFAAGSEQR